MALTVGDQAPAFALPATGGQTISLDALKGRKAVIYFYPKDDTSGCTQEAKDFQSRRAEFAAAGTEVIGVSPDGLRSHDKFRTKYGLDFPLVADEGRQLIEALGLWVEKSLYGRRYMGVQRTTLLLDREGRIAKVWSNVKVPGHADQVLEAARAL